jgi:pilus assembly protein CpaF
MREVAAAEAGDARVAVREQGAARADGTALLEREVRELVRRRGVDPVAEPERFAELVQEAAMDYADRAARGVLSVLPDMERAVRKVSDAVGGLGPLRPYLDDLEIEEIWVNSPSRAANLLLVPHVGDSSRRSDRIR